MSKTLSVKYYQKNKFAKEIKIFLKKKKKKSTIYGCERYKNLSEDEK